MPDDTEIEMLTLSKSCEHDVSDQDVAAHVDGLCPLCLQAEVTRLREGLTAAIRAAKLALFVIRKQGVMPNSSWESGFEKDLKAATDARGDEQRHEDHGGDK